MGSWKDVGGSQGSPPFVKEGVGISDSASEQPSGSIASSRYALMILTEDLFQGEQS